MRVLVAHPNRQHSHQLALALADEGMLLQYIVGVPSHEEAGWRFARPLIRNYARPYRIDLSRPLIRHVFISTITQKAAGRLLPRAKAVSLAHRADGWFDWYVARDLARLRPDIVVGYENACLAMFQQARQLNITTVLDAASFHHSWQDRFYHPAESPRAHARIVARKGAEIQLADRVLTVSEFARDSYVDAGVPADHVHAIPMGVALERFKRHEMNGVVTHNRPIRFIFVGHVDERKGADVLREAVRLLTDANVPCDVGIIGNYTSNIRFDGLANVNSLGWIPHDRLAAVLTKHDVLVLPSRHDSFGMVVAEAMACGLPAIVSDQVGAKEMVEPQVNGLVVPAGDAAALADAMEWFIDHRDQISAMIPAARAAAERYSWQAYRERIVRLIKQFASETSVSCVR